MPYPIIAAAAAATAAAGAGMGIAANQQVNSAMRNAVDAEIARQRGYQKQNESVLAQSLEQSGAEYAQQEMGGAAKSREQEYRDIGNRQMAQYDTADRAETKEVKTGTETKAARSDVDRARLMAQDDWLLHQRIKDLRAAQQLGLTSSMAQSSANLLQSDLIGAQHAGDDLRGLGQLVGGLGTLAGVVGAGAGSAPSEVNSRIS